MIVIIGSGIIGLFIANELLESGKKLLFSILKKKRVPHQHQLGC